MENKQLEERAFRKLLQQASQPEPPAGSEERLLARLTAAPAAGGNVVPLLRPVVKPQRRWMAAALPLAASLLLGILIGSDSMLESYLPDSVASLIQPAGLELDLPALLDGGDELDGDLA